MWFDERFVCRRRPLLKRLRRELNLTLNLVLGRLTNVLNALTTPADTMNGFQRASSSQFQPRAALELVQSSTPKSSSNSRNKNGCNRTPLKVHIYRTDEALHDPSTH